MSTSFRIIHIFGNIIKCMFLYQISGSSLFWSKIELIPLIHNLKLNKNINKFKTTVTVAEILFLFMN